MSLPLFGMLLFFHASAYAQWTFVDPPSVSADWWLREVCFTSPNEGWAVGIDATNRREVVFHYAGGSWSSVSLPPAAPIWDIRGVHFISSSEGWVVGSGTNDTSYSTYWGLALHYVGDTWTTVSLPSVSEKWELHNVHFTSSNEGWAVGEDDANKKGVLLRYSGGIWTSVPPPSVSAEWWLYKVHFISPDKGWAVGEDKANKKGVLLRYTGGAWTSVDLPFASALWWLSGVHFSSASEGWAVGADSTNARGLLLHYSGSTWTSLTVPFPGMSFIDVYFSSPDNGWVVGWDYMNHRGVLLHYSGGSWTSVDPPPLSSSDWMIYGVSLPSSTEGWAVGWDTTNRKGILLHYASSAPPPDTWIGEVSLPLKITSTDEETLGNRKFRTHTNTLAGEINLFMGGEGPVPNTEGCYAKFTGDDGTKVCFNQMASISTDVDRNRSDQLLFVGTGSIIIPIDGTPMTGIAYVDVKGTLKKDSSGKITSISLNGKIGGGINSENIFNATLKAALKRL